MYHRIRFHRPEELWVDFTLESKAEGTTSRGRVREDYASAEPVQLHATLCGATTEQRLQFQQIGHPITHVIGLDGAPVAKAGDLLIHGNRAFYVQGVDNPGEQSIWAIYYCEERSDTHDGTGNLLA